MTRTPSTLQSAFRSFRSRASRWTTPIALAAAAGFALAAVPAATAMQQGDDASKGRRQEERRDYYKKWLGEDVAYIITDQEKDVFKSLTTDAEKEQFIEQFWQRRDPDLRTGENEYKAEHYRRIAYANERFTSGVAGWKTDRGRVYIIHGPPAEIESHKTGESYQRPSSEGGGFTAVFAFEIWRYRYVEGLGNNVELEFVDPSGSGEFHLARTPWEKDALLFTPGAGLTIAESLGQATRADHPYFSPSSEDRYLGMSRTLEDTPFQRYEKIVRIQDPATIKYGDLKEIVNVDVRYDELPLRVRTDYFWLNERQVLVPITVDVQNRDLTFKEEDGFQVARIAVYGLVTSITNRVVAEFDHELVASYRPQDLKAGLLGRSMYQKIIPVEDQMRYKIDLVVKDLNSGKIGHLRQGILPPKRSAGKLMASSVVLSDHILEVQQADDEEMFVLGNIKIRPSIGNTFSPENPLGVYLHLYNAVLDQTTHEPSLHLRYRLTRDGEPIVEVDDSGGDSIYYTSGQRVVLIRRLPVQGLAPGRYRLDIEVEDRIANQSVTTGQSFRLGEDSSLGSP